MSLPCIARPTSARSWDFFSAVFVSLILAFAAGQRPWANKKPTAVASRGFLLNLVLSATRTGGGVVFYNDPDQNSRRQRRIRAHFLKDTGSAPPVKRVFNELKKSRDWLRQAGNWVPVWAITGIRPGG